MSKIVKDTWGEPDPGEFEKLLETTLTEAAVVVQSNIVPLVPVDTGRLRASITFRTSDGKGNELGDKAQAGDQVSTPGNKHIAHVGTNVEYAAPVEYRKPYLRLGLDVAKPLVSKLFQDRMGKWFAGGSA